MESDDSTLSIDPVHPTTFTSTRTVTFPAGLELPDVLRWETVVLQANLDMEIVTHAAGILNNRRFSGRFGFRMQIVEPSTIVEMEGPLEIHLA